jgi:hypothetical protein
MTASHGETVLFDSVDLLPEPWKLLANAGPVRAFNPGLLRDGAGWIFACRIVAMDGLRRIALCRLDHKLHVVAGSAVPWSDDVCSRPGRDLPGPALTWFADPRLYRLDDRLWIYWNSGWHEPHNCQFLQEIHPQTLQPVGYPRELLLTGERRKLEKNWTCFSDERGQLRAIYSVLPHRVLAFSLAGDADITFEPIATQDWTLGKYPASHGGLRGGAPPVLFAGEYWSFCHSVHDGASGYNYQPAAYAFSASAPFAPTARPIAPLQFAAALAGKRDHPRLNPAVNEVIYPCGAAHDGARWLVSHGINDERCAISIVSHADVLASIERLPALE